MPIRSLIRTIPNYPQEGIMFRDITTLLKDPKGMRLTIDLLVEQLGAEHIDKVAGIEARGFILAGAIAVKLQAGFVPIRKKGKLPFDTIGEDYELEYGRDRLEMHVDAIAEGERVFLVDDLIATGGTAIAGIKLIERAKAEIAAVGFIVDLPDLGGSKRVIAAGHRLLTLCSFEGE